jgi:hypothetical protein
MNEIREHHSNGSDRGRPKYPEKTCLSATFSTTNPTWSGLGANPGLHSERMATNRLIRGIA